jgi:hypothetical protein
MTGLNLESFLRLLRADLGAWVILSLAACLLLLMTWTSWGSRRALRKCLVLSVTAHVGLALYGSTFLIVLLALQPRRPEDETSRARIRQIRVAPWLDEEVKRVPGGRGAGGSGSRLMPWDRPGEILALADPKLDAPRTESTDSGPLSVAPPPAPPALAAGAATPELAPASVPDPGARPKPDGPAEAAAPPTQAAPSAPDEVAAPVIAPRDEPPAEPDTAPEPRPDGDSGGRIRPQRASASPPAMGRTAPETAVPVATSPEFITARSREGPTAIEGTASLSLRPGGPDADTAAAAPAESPAAPEVVKPPAAAPQPPVPETDVRLRSRPVQTAGSSAAPELAAPGRTATPMEPIALARVVPGGLPRAPGVGRAGSSFSARLRDVPEVYRSRLDPNRSVVAQRAGASPASEQSVERALDWLARHQDSDGRWDGSTARYEDGTPVRGDDDYTVHCPPGEPCFGECIYWEADTALTGLALLAYLGSGYTQADGKYAETVGKGLDFLLLQQKPDGDLRGRSQAVGMYCHAMAALALCEAYALTGDERLRDPVERAIAFLVRARARDGLSWRYKPGAPIGDTSILGWVVMALKSAKVVGIPVSTSVRNGTLSWLDKVAGGRERGLASYQPREAVTPTMTAEAWVCRQFLGVGGPGPASNEAADYLLVHGPDRDPYNLYYWYYGTLAMYQHGGDAWTRWNSTVRDQIIRRQHASGHIAGSWDPDDSLYGLKGGRIYCTALATLTLEVYYRFLRLYDDPKLPAAGAAATPPRGPDDEPAARRGTP